MKKRTKSSSFFSGRLGAREQLLILAGCLVLAVIALIILPQDTSSAANDERSELELRDQLSGAADAYMLAETTQQRQAAARKIRATKTGSRSVTSSSSETFGALRWLLIITILVLAYRIILLVRAGVRLRKAPGS